MTIKVQWPSAIAQQAEAWRILDLSGMTNSVRESRNFTRAGFLYIDGNQTHSLGTRIDIGAITVLELRFPNGKIISQEIMVINRPTVRTTQRSSMPTTLNRRG